MHICPVCTAAAIQTLHDNMPLLVRLWYRARCFVIGLFQRRDNLLRSAADYEEKSRA